jgi:hypothetical protein
VCESVAETLEDVWVRPVLSLTTQWIEQVALAATTRLSIETAVVAEFGAVNEKAWPSEETIDHWYL